MEGHRELFVVLVLPGQSRPPLKRGRTGQNGGSMTSLWSLHRPPDQSGRGKRSAFIELAATCSNGWTIGPHVHILNTVYSTNLCSLLGDVHVRILVMYTAFVLSRVRGGMNIIRPEKGAEEEEGRGTATLGASYHGLSSTVAMVAGEGGATIDRATVIRETLIDLPDSKGGTKTVATKMKETMERQERRNIPSGVMKAAVGGSKRRVVPTDRDKMAREPPPPPLLLVLKGTEVTGVGSWLPGEGGRTAGTTIRAATAMTKRRGVKKMKRGSQILLHPIITTTIIERSNKLIAREEVMEGRISAVETEGLLLEATVIEEEVVRLAVGVTTVGKLPARSLKRATTSSLILVERNGQSFPLSKLQLVADQARSIQRVNRARSIQRVNRARSIQRVNRARSIREIN